MRIQFLSHRLLCPFYRFPALGDRLGNRGTDSFFQLQPRRFRIRASAGRRLEGSRRGRVAGSTGHRAGAAMGARGPGCLEQLSSLADDSSSPSSVSSTNVEDLLPRRCHVPFAHFGEPAESGSHAFRARSAIHGVEFSQIRMTQWLPNPLSLSAWRRNRSTATAATVALPLDELPHCTKPHPVSPIVLFLQSFISVPMHSLGFVREGFTHIRGAAQLHPNGLSAS